MSNDGNRMVVGAKFDDTPGSSAGSVEVGYTTQAPDLIFSIISSIDILSNFSPVSRWK